jgi:hemolysin D
MVSTNGTKVVDGRVVDSQKDRIVETEPTPAEATPEGRAANRTNGDTDNAPVDGKHDVKKRLDKTTRMLKKQKPKQAKIHPAVIKFQPDAIEIERRSVAGGFRMTLYVVVLLIVALVVWASWAKVDRIVTAHGKLTITSHPVVIQPGATMPIVEMYVKFGDVVEAGQRLAKLDPIFSEADVKKLESDKDGLLALISRLNAELADRPFELADRSTNEKWMVQKQVYNARKEELGSKKAEYQAGRQKLMAEKDTNVTEIKNLDEQLATHEKVVQKYVTLLKTDAVAETKLYEAELNLNQARRMVDTAKHRAVEIKYEIEALDKQESAYIANWISTTSSQLAEAKQKLDATQEDLNKALHMREMVYLTVPNDLPNKKFFVLEVADRSAGSVARVGDPIFKLIPLNSELEVEAEIESKDIGRLVVGDEVRIKLPSFPYQKHGTLKGKLARISEGSFEKGEAPVTKTIYRVKIELTSTKLDQVPDEVRLMPGMIAECEIKIGTRRVIEYFIYPLIRYFDSSIREP